SSSDRYFRSIMRQETVWALLHARDHVFVSPGQQINCIREQFERIAVLSDRITLGGDSQALDEAWRRLLAVQRLLMETCDQVPSYSPPRTRVCFFFSRVFSFVKNIGVVA